MRNSIKQPLKLVIPHNEQRKIREPSLFYLLYIVQVDLPVGTYIFKIVVAVFRMQFHTAVHLVGTLRKFHNYRYPLFLHQLYNVFGGGGSRDYSQSFFLTGHVQASPGTGGYKGWNTSYMLHRQAVGLQFLEDVMYGSVESRIAFGNDAHIFTFLLQGCGFGIHAVVSGQSQLTLFAHGQCEAVYDVVGNAEQHN